MLTKCSETSSGGEEATDLHFFLICQTNEITVYTGYYSDDDGYTDVFDVCGGQNIKRDAHAEWNAELQMWELSNTYDDFFCEDCEHEVSVFEKVLT